MKPHDCCWYLGCIPKDVCADRAAVAAELLDSGCAELAEVQTAFLAEACEGGAGAVEGGKGEL